MILLKFSTLIPGSPNSPVSLLMLFRGKKITFETPWVFLLFQAIKLLSLNFHSFDGAGAIGFIVPASVDVLVVNLNFDNSGIFPKVTLHGTPRHLHCKISEEPDNNGQNQAESMARLGCIIYAGQFTTIGLQFDLSFDIEFRRKLYPVADALSAQTSLTTMSLNFELLLWIYESLPSSLKVLYVNFSPTVRGSQQPEVSRRMICLEAWIHGDHWSAWMPHCLVLAHLIVVNEMEEDKSGHSLKFKAGCGALVDACEKKRILVSRERSDEQDFPAIPKEYIGKGFYN